MHSGTPSLRKQDLLIGKFWDVCSFKSFSIVPTCMSLFIVEAFQILRALYQKKTFTLMWNKLLNQKAEILLPYQLDPLGILATY